MLKVLVFIFLPLSVVPANNPYRLIEDYSGSVYTASNGIISYEISSYVIADYPGKLPDRDLIDYRGFITEYDLVERHASDEFDEVWLLGGDDFGFRESQMVGETAYRVNSPPVLIRDCEDFIIMGFNYERGVKEMLHSFGHRVENVLAYSYDAYYELDWCYDNPYPGDLEPITEFGEYLKSNGTVHQEPYGEDFGQDEFEWLSGIPEKFWKIVL
jgi:hypothetical protein